MENLDSRKNINENIIPVNETIGSVSIPEIIESDSDKIAKINNKLNKEQEVIESTTKAVEEIRKSLGIDGQKVDIPSIELNIKNKSKLESALNKISNVANLAKIATLGTGMFVGAGNLNAQNIDQYSVGKIKSETEKNINIEKEKIEAVNGGNIEEVTVYSQSKYQDELKKQRDYLEWVRANQSYQDSLKLHEKSKKQLDKMIGMVGFLGEDGKTRLTEEEVLKKNKDIDPMWDGTYGQVEYGDFRSVANDYKGHAYAVLHDMGMSDDGQMYSNESEDNKSWASENRDKAEDYISKIEHDTIKPKFVPILHFGHPYDPKEPKYNYRPLYDKPKGKMVKFPHKTENILNKKIIYDPTYKNIKMRSLWANQIKVDPNTKIGALNPLDYNDESKGFTLDEAMAFPQEIKDQFNIDYIYNQIHGTKKQKEDYKHPGWNYDEPTK